MAITFDRLERLVEETIISNTEIFMKEGAADMGQQFARDTPVDTGKATANWHGSIDSEDLVSLNRFDQSLTARPTRNAIRAELDGYVYGQNIYVQNAVKGDKGEGYIIQLEHGKSKQSPNGMVLINLRNAQNVYNRAYQGNL